MKDFLKYADNIPVIRWIGQSGKRIAGFIMIISFIAGFGLGLLL